MSRGCPVAVAPDGRSMVRVRDGERVTGAVGLTMSWQLARAIASDRLSRRGPVRQAQVSRKRSAASVTIRTGKVHNPAPSSQCSSWRETRGLQVIDRKRQAGPARRQLPTRACAGCERRPRGGSADVPGSFPRAVACGGGAAAIISRRAPRGNAQPILAFPSASRRIINSIHDRTLPP